MKQRPLHLFLAYGFGLSLSVFGCAGEPGSTANDVAAEAAGTIVGPDDELALRPSALDVSTECWAQIERPFPADLTLKIGTPITLRTGGPICPEGVNQKLAYRFYVEKVDRNGNILAPRSSPQGLTEWSFTKSAFDTSGLTPGRHRIYLFSLPRTMIDAWKANDPVARNRSTRSGNAYVTFVNTDWAAGSFGACSVACGAGTQTRTVTCTDDFGGAHPDSWCTQAKPDASQACEGTSCAPPDTAGPVLSAASPAANATGVAADVTLSATYDEPLAAGSTFTLKRGATTIAGTTMVSGNTITFTPSAALRMTVSTYTVTINAVDATGNQTLSSYTFQTRDATAPTFETYPSDGQTGVARFVNLTVSANEVLAANSTITLTKVSTGAVISGSKWVDGLSMVFDPDMQLESFTTYKGVYVAFDAAGNSSTTEITFTTGSSSF